MSRAALAVVLAAWLASYGAGALAQNAAPADGAPAAAATPALPAGDDSSKEPTLAERLLTSPREPRCADDGVDSAITVCGKKKDNTSERLPLPGELQSATAVNDGVPRAPDLFSNRITGHAISLGCGLGGCPPALLPDIDFSKMPADPAGSDADRIGKGEIRGN